MQPGATEVLGRAQVNGFRFGLVALAILYLVELSDEFGVRERLAMNRPIRWAAAYGLICLVLLLGRFQTEQFIYFQF